MENYSSLSPLLNVRHSLCFRMKGTENQRAKLHGHLLKRFNVRQTNVKTTRTLKQFLIKTKLASIKRLSLHFSFREYIPAKHHFFTN